MLHILNRLTLSMLLICLAMIAHATGPRIKQDLFTANANTIHALDFPPFVSADLADGGMAIELVHAVLQAQKIDAAINTLPVAKMLKYYLFQDKALAAIGNNLGFSAEQQKDLIVIPLLTLKEYLYCYQAKYPQGLPWKGDLKTLTGMTYGAATEAPTARFEQAGIKIERGQILSLLEKLKVGKIDFLANSELAINWYLDRNLATEKAQFIRLEPALGQETLTIVFNKKHPQGETLAQKFKEGLAALKANGQYKALLQKHLGDDQTIERYLQP